MEARGSCSTHRANPPSGDCNYRGIGSLFAVFVFPSMKKGTTNLHVFKSGITKLFVRKQALAKRPPCCYLRTEERFFPTSSNSRRAGYTSARRGLLHCRVSARSCRTVHDLRLPAAMSPASVWQTTFAPRQP